MEENKFKELKETLQNNQCSTLYVSLGVRIEFSVEQWKQFLEALAENSSVHTLYLQNCNIDAERAKALAEVLRQNRRVKVLDLGENPIGSEGARALCRDIGLEELELTKCELGVQGAEAVAETLCWNKSLVSLNVSSNYFGDIGIQKISQVVRWNTTLQILLLDSCGVGASGIGRLAKALSFNANLQVLDLSNNRKIGDKGAALLFEVLCGDSNLENLDLRNTGITAAGAKSLAITLRHNRSLKTVNLNRNDIRHEGAEVLSEALFFNKILRVLKLGSNNIGDTGAIALSRLLSGHCSLEGLHLQENKIGLSGVRALTMALCHNRVLVDFDLSDNLFENADVKTWFVPLMRCVSVVGLIGGAHGLNVSTARSLNFGSIVSMGFMSFIGIMSWMVFANLMPFIAIDEKRVDDTIARFAPLLRRLCLRKNNLDEGARAFAKMLRENTTLQSSDLCNNQISVNGTEMLIEALDKNTTVALRLHGGLERGAGDDKINRFLERNNKIRLREKTNVAREGILIAFVRANFNNQLRYSILALIPEILQLAQFGAVRPRRMINLDRFIDSRFLQAQIKINEHLLEAVAQDNLQEVKKMLAEPGIDINATKLPECSSALQLATQASRIPIIEALLAKERIRLGHKDKTGKTALAIAKEKENVEIITLLNNAPANCTLHRSAKIGAVQWVRRALELGADLDSVQSEGLTALELLSSSPLSENEKEEVRALITAAMETREESFMTPQFNAKKVANVGSKTGALKASEGLTRRSRFQ